MSRRARTVLAGVVTLGVLAACGGGSDDASSPATTPAEIATTDGGAGGEATGGGGAAETTSGTEADAGSAGSDEGTGTTTGSGSDEGTGTEAETGADGTCTVTVTGDRQDSWAFEQGIASFSSDYWTPEDQLRDAVDMLGEDIAGGSYEELVAAGKPIITFMSLACTDQDTYAAGALVTPTNATLAGDFPMAPGSYPITGGLFDAEGPAGTVIADLSVPEDEVYGTVAGSGTLEITTWDRARIEGTFAFTAREAFSDSPKEVQVTVTFSFVCDHTVGGC